MTHTTPLTEIDLITKACEIVVLERLTRRALNERRYYAAYACAELICDNIDALEIEVEEFNARMELEGSD